MSELHELQKVFQDFVLCGDEVFKQNVDGRDNQFITTRAAIYHDAYRLRLAGVLRTDYPALHTLAGDEQFEKICQEYIESYPSEHFSVRYFGQNMQDFLTTTSPFSKHRVLVDIAGFEWAIGEVLDAQDGPLLSLENLRDISPALWAEMRIKLHPSVRTILLEWNAPKFWQAVNEEKQPESPTGYTTAVTWLLWRKGLEVYYRSLSEAEASILAAAGHGKTFAELCEKLCQWMDEDEVAVRAAEFIQTWVSEGIISSVELNGMLKTEP